MTDMQYFIRLEQCPLTRVQFAPKMFLLVDQHVFVGTVVVHWYVADVMVTGLAVHDFCTLLLYHN